MSEMSKSAGLYKMVAFYFFLFSINSLSSAIVASFLNTDWHALSPTQRFLLFVVIFQNWTGVMLAFFNKSIQRAEQGQPIIPISPAGGTEMWVRQAEAITPIPGTTKPIEPKP